MRLFSVFLAATFLAHPADLRLGIVGTDTSHVITFIRHLNDPSHKDHVPGARIVAAYKGGSKDMKVSYERVDTFAADLVRDWKVEIVADIATLCSKVDGVLLSSVDGRIHLAQFKEIVKSRKPVFIDKPLAASLNDAREIARIAKEAGVPWFSSSPLRYGDSAAKMRFPDLKGAFVWGPGPLDPMLDLDLAWYAIHSVEMLYAIMGPGVVEVSRFYAEDADLLVGRWKDGRIGTVRAMRPARGYGSVAFREKRVEQATGNAGSYPGLMRELVKFFQTKQPPVPNEETLEIFSFLDAAGRSKAAGGKPVALSR